MNSIIVLDTGVLGASVHQNTVVRNPILTWVANHLANGNSFRIPEIADYELRRELIRNNFAQSIADLDKLKAALGYIPLNTPTMLEAAALWAVARQAAKPTAHDHALDGDVILCAQTIRLQAAYPNDTVIVATTNLGHLERFVTASIWQNIAV
ncbi:hypothetical protein BH10CYA1_BH10CYA1_56230 [soil metagenome]